MMETGARTNMRNTQMMTNVPPNSLLPPSKPGKKSDPRRLPL